jgi:hypothetical protein
MKRPVHSAHVASAITYPTFLPHAILRRSSSTNTLLGACLGYLSGALLPLLRLPLLLLPLLHCTLNKDTNNFLMPLRTCNIAGSIAFLQNETETAYSRMTRSNTASKSI